MGFLTESQLASAGFRALGKNVRISERASIYGASRISIGDNSRIDDFCILSAGEDGIVLGQYVHIAAYCSLIGKGLIEMKDFSGLSSRVSVYSSSDDYSGESLTNPTVPDQYRNVAHGAVTLGKHVIIGAGAIILPKVEIGDGSAVGALSLVVRDVPAGIIVNGVPAKKLKDRSGRIFELEKALRDQQKI